MFLVQFTQLVRQKFYKLKLQLVVAVKLPPMTFLIFLLTPLTDFDAV
jgi:hypothetical protein